MDLHAHIRNAKPKARPKTHRMYVDTWELMHEALHGSRQMDSLDWVLDETLVRGYIENPTAWRGHPYACSQRGKLWGACIVGMQSIGQGCECDAWKEAEEAWRAAWKGWEEAYAKATQDGGVVPEDAYIAFFRDQADASPTASWSSSSLRLRCPSKPSTCRRKLAAGGRWATAPRRWSAATLRRPRTRRRRACSGSRDEPGVPLSESGFGQRTTRWISPLVGHHVCMARIRESFASSDHGEALAQMEVDAQVFGHSLEMQRTYVKFDAPK